MRDVLPILSDEEKEQGTPGVPASETPESGFGALMTPRGALAVRARLDGLIARVDLAQVFLNAHPEPLEATYIFPLPDRAAVTRFRLEVAGRVVEGELRERGSARGGEGGG